MRAAEVREILEAHGLSVRKDVGQHFLLDERVAERAVERAGAEPGETVLEIGPGLGLLTMPLARAFDEVVAIEIDRGIADLLRGRLDEAGHANVEVRTGDVLNVDWPDVDAIVANLPYQISSPLTFRLLETDVDRAVLMYQREFAERLCAKAGEDGYGRMTVMAMLHADREIVEAVPAGAFWPEPDVDGAVVELTMRPPPFEVVDAELFAEVVRSLFMHRRKQSKNALGLHLGALGVDRGTLDAALDDWGLGRTRPGKLTPAEIGELVTILAERR